MSWGCCSCQVGKQAVEGVKLQTWKPAPQGDMARRSAQGQQMFLVIRVSLWVVANKLHFPGIVTLLSDLIR